jgi:osmotically-inducible protein OsmY
MARWMSENIMLQHPVPQPRNPRLRPLRSLAAGILVSFLAFSAPAADPASAPPAISDVVLARSALSALDGDPQLRDVSLLVSVVNRVALVGGPVSSPEQSKRAEAIVRQVPGIVDVKNRCYVQAAPDPLLRAMSDRYPSSPRRVLASELPGMVASPKTGVVEEYSPAPGENNLAAVAPTETSVVARRPMNPGASVLLPPISLPNSKTSTAPATTTDPAPAVLTSRPADALASAETARKANPRFARLSVSLANGTLVVTGAAARASDAWALAQELRRIPGVTRVAIGDVVVK